MKNRKSKLLSFSVLALCLACLAFGVYALKSATLTVKGTIGFTAHDCLVNVVATIAGDGVETVDGVVTPSANGSPSAERTLFTQDVGGKTKAEWDVEKNIGQIYFTDLTDDGIPETITLKFTVTNNSDYKIYARINNSSIEGITTTATTTDVLIEEDATGELTATFTLNATEGEYVDIQAALDFNVTLDFGKYVEATNEEVVIEDFVFRKYGEEWSLVAYNGTDTTVTLPSVGPEGSNYVVGRDRSSQEMQEEMEQLGISTDDQEASMAYLANFCPFMMNSTIQKVIVPSSVTGFGLASFTMSSLSEIEFKEATNFVVLGEGSLYGCANLTFIQLPDSLTTIRTGSLGATGLTSIVIPASVDTMEEASFQDNASLTNIYCRAVSQPETWDLNWNYNENITPEFGYQG